jgi:hypothetical protein
MFPTFAHGWYQIIDLSTEKLAADEDKVMKELVSKETYCVIGNDVLRVDHVPIHMSRCCK